jgi:hypothetical protein
VFLASPVGVVSLPVGATNVVSRGRPKTTVQVLHRGVVVLSCPYASCSIGRGQACDNKYGMVVTLRSWRYAPSLHCDGGVFTAS